MSRARLGVCAGALMLAACASGWGPNEARSGAPLSPQPDPTAQHNGVDVMPRRISGSAAVYPFSASMNNDCGSALLEFTIGADGRTKDIKVLESSTPYFGGHSAHAVQGWVFEPARKDGQAVELTVRQGFSFSPSGPFRNAASCGPDTAPAQQR